MTNWTAELPHAVLSPELVDRLDEIITGAASPHYRAEAVLTLLGQIYEATAWLHDLDFDTDDGELASLAEVVTAAVNHQARMRGAGREPLPS